MSKSVLYTEDKSKMKYDIPEVTEYGGLAVVRAPGSLEKDDAERIRSIMLNCLNNGNTQLALDMEAVPYINSDGLRMIQDVLRQAESLEASLALVNANSRVLRTLNITRLDTQVAVYASIDEAIRQNS
ncbi:MAG: STAS domain-containing protein [Armatimonadota bacterium]|nr:STAS domain-containing protein [Armatimonadota bacterium]